MRLAVRDSAANRRADSRRVGWVDEIHVQADGDACCVVHGVFQRFAHHVALPAIEALGHGSGTNWSLSRWGKSTGKWAEKDMDVALDLAQSAKMPMPLAGLVDQLVKHLNQERMKSLLS